MRILHRRPSNSIKHSEMPALGDAISSKNAAGGGRDRTPRRPSLGAIALPDGATERDHSSSRFSLLYSKRDALEV
jgi:hypothetical protein